MSGSRRIYVGNLPPDVRSKDVDDLFYKYGKIASVDIKSSKSGHYAFVEFEDHRDAEDAVDRRDGYDFDGYKLRVEFTIERSAGGGGRSGRGFGGNSSRGGDMRGRGVRKQRSNYRVLVTGLPPSGSWQDLKDHMRDAGDICFADTFKDGTGIVEFVRLDDMKYAVRKMDDTRFRSHEGESSYIRVKEDASESRDRSRSRSRSRRRTRSRSASASKSKSSSRSRSRSRSRTPSADKKR